MNIAGGIDLPSGTTPMPWTWQVEPVVCILLLVLGATYLVGLVRQSREARLPKGVLWRALSFATGIALLGLALLSPLDAWGDQLFAAHMAQHLILMMVAPPLLILGRPIIVAVWALPRGTRHTVGAWWLRGGAVRQVFNVVSTPVSAWVLASAALWFWHLRKPYALAFTDPVAHALEHLSFFLTAILFWRVVIYGQHSGRIAVGATMILVVTYGAQSAMLGAILIFAPVVLYGVHAVAPAWSPLTPLADQQLAGVLMWSVTWLVDLLALCLLFIAWLASSDRKTRRA